MDLPILRPQFLTGYSSSKETKCCVLRVIVSKAYIGDIVSLQLSHTRCDWTMDEISNEENIRAMGLTLYKAFTIFKHC